MKRSSDSDKQNQKEVKESRNVGVWLVSFLIRVGQHVRQKKDMEVWPRRLAEEDESGG
jgi:hypothetical protein